MNTETIMPPETAAEAGSMAAIGRSDLFGGVPARKLEYLTDRGAKVVCVKVYFEMPNGDEGMLDSWGRVDWNGMRPGILNRELAEITQPPNEKGQRRPDNAASSATKGNE